MPGSCSAEGVPQVRTKFHPEIDIYIVLVVRVGWGGGGEALNTMHGRSRTTIDARAPTMPGRTTLSFHRPGRHCSLH